MESKILGVLVLIVLVTTLVFSATAILPLPSGSIVGVEAGKSIAYYLKVLDARILGDASAVEVCVPPATVPPATPGVPAVSTPPATPVCTPPQVAPAVPQPAAASPAAVGTPGAVSTTGKISFTKKNGEYFVHVTNSDYESRFCITLDKSAFPSSMLSATQTENPMICFTKPVAYPMSTNDISVLFLSNPSVSGAELNCYWGPGYRWAPSKNESIKCDAEWVDDGADVIELFSSTGVTVDNSDCAGGYLGFFQTCGGNYSVKLTIKGKSYPGS